MLEESLLCRRDRNIGEGGEVTAHNKLEVGWQIEQERDQQFLRPRTKTRCFVCFEALRCAKKLRKTDARAERLWN